MPVILESNHALKFDGVSDSVIIPQGLFTKVGRKNADGDHQSADIISSSSQGSRGVSVIGGKLTNKIAIEAWVVPDCGGTIVSKENQFSLSMGTVDTPGPAIFRVKINTESGPEIINLRTALLTSNGYDGTVYPPNTFDGVDDSYNRFDPTKNDATSLNLNQRPLFHGTAKITSKIFYYRVR